jgi:hypothetical protein
MRLEYNSIIEDLNTIIHDAHRRKRSVKKIILNQEEFEELKKDTGYVEGSGYSASTFCGIPIHIEYPCNPSEK